MSWKPSGQILSFGQIGSDSVILSWFYGRMARALRIEPPGGGGEGHGSTSQASVNNLLLFAAPVLVVDPVPS